MSSLLMRNHWRINQDFMQATECPHSIRLCLQQNICWVSCSLRLYHHAGTALFWGHGHAITSLLQEFSVSSQCTDIMLRLLSQCTDIMLQLLSCLSRDMKNTYPSYRWGLTWCFQERHTTNHSQSSSLIGANGRTGSTQTTNRAWSGTQTGPICSPQHWCWCVQLGFEKTTQIQF